MSAGRSCLPCFSSPFTCRPRAWDAAFRTLGWLFSWEASPAAAGLQGWLATIWVHGLAAVPWVVLIVGTGLLLVESDLEESALLDGSLAQVTCRVTFVQAMPALFVAALWVFVLSSGEIAVTDLYQIRTYAEEVYTSVPLTGLQSSSAWQRGSADAPRSADRGDPGWGLTGCRGLLGSRQPACWRSDRSGDFARRLAYGGLGYWVGALLLLAGVPLVMLVFQAGIVVEPRGDEWLRSWSWQKLLQTVGGSPLEFREEYAWSLLIGGSAATAAVAGAAPLAWLARRCAAARVRGTRRGRGWTLRCPDQPSGCA